MFSSDRCTAASANFSEARARSSRTDQTTTNTVLTVVTLSKRTWKASKHDIKAPSTSAYCRWPSFVKRKGEGDQSSASGLVSTLSHGYYSFKEQTRLVQPTFNKNRKRSLQNRKTMRFLRACATQKSAISARHFVDGDFLVRPLHARLYKRVILFLMNKDSGQRPIDVP